MTKPKAVSMSNQLAQSSASKLKLKQNHNEVKRWTQTCEATVLSQNSLPVSLFLFLGTLSTLSSLYV